MTFRLSVNLNALNAALDAKQKQVQQAVRPAAHAGALVLYQAVLRNVDAIGSVTGNLRRGIYHAYSQDSSQHGNRATYHISWNARKAPHGNLVEWGHIKKYVSYVGKDGNWYTAKYRGTKNTTVTRVKRSDGKMKSIKGTPIPLPGGPIQVAGKAFVRGAASYFPQPQQAMRKRFLLVVNQKA